MISRIWRSARMPAMSLAFCALLASGCVTNLEAPDLGDLYNRSARFHDETRNPIVVVPGFLGSKLVDEESGRVVWGAFGGGAANPQKSDGARLTALPMREGAAFTELRDGIRSDGALDRIKVRLFGIPLQLDAYFYILATLGAGGYRDETLGKLNAIDYGEDHFTCFQFDYDWRRDNVENAALLQDFLLEKRAYVRAEMKKRFGVDNPNIKFDVITHSMGGLIVRYLLQYGAEDLPEDGSLPQLTWAGADLVDRVILVSPPNAGSLDTMKSLTEGKKFHAFLPRYEPALLGTMPSLYQMLPRTRHAAVVDGETGAPLDVFDPGLWERMGWGLLDPDQDKVLRQLMPEVEDVKERRRIALDHLTKSLRRARQFQAALDVDAVTPEGVELYLVAGDAMDTDATMTVDPRTGDIAVSEKRAGDGTVLRTSALMDERVGGAWTPMLRSPIRWRSVTFLFKDHLGLTQDPTFTDNMLYLLLEDVREPTGASAYHP